MVHYGQRVPKGLYGWGGYGGSGGQKLMLENQEIFSVFLWDQEKQLSFVYIPTYLAW